MKFIKVFSLIVIFSVIFLVKPGQTDEVEIVIKSNAKIDEFNIRGKPDNGTQIDVSEKAAATPAIEGPAAPPAPPADAAPPKADDSGAAEADEKADKPAAPAPPKPAAK